MTTEEFLDDILPRKPMVESNLDRLHRETREAIEQKREEDEMLRHMHIQFPAIVKKYTCD